MAEIQMGIVESKFADIIWDNVPVSTSELVKLAEEAFDWKRTTTHTVIKRLCEKGIFINEKGIVRSLISKEEFYSLQSRKYVEESFSGSLPAFVAAFTKNRRLSKEEADEIRRMIEEAID